MIDKSLFALLQRTRQIDGFFLFEVLMLTFEETKQFYKSPAWKLLRARVLRRDKYICQYNKRYGKVVEAKVVHHILPLEFYPEHRLKQWNLISLSTGAHERLHNRNEHTLTLEGWRLMEKTAQDQGITLTNEDKVICLGLGAVNNKPI